MNMDDMRRARDKQRAHIRKISEDLQKANDRSDICEARTLKPQLYHAQLRLQEIERTIERETPLDSRPSSNAGIFYGSNH